LRRFNLAKNIRKANDINDLYAFFEVMNGPEHSFAITNILDDRSCKPENTPAASRRHDRQRRRLKCRLSS
jgi:hypothetical protein